MKSSRSPTRTSTSVVRPPSAEPSALSHNAPAPDAPGSVDGLPIPLREAVDTYKRRLVREAVEKNNGNWAAAARDLGVARGNLHHLARRLGLKD